MTSKYMLFILGGVVFPAYCHKPSRRARDLASLICSKPEEVAKDRFDLFNAPAYGTEELDAIIEGVLN